MGGQSGSVIALEPRTGEVLAYISTPGYDPNAFSAGIKPEEWGRLTRDPEKPLINRVIQGQYPPGSTFKVLSALAALQEGVITPQTRFHCPGYLAVYGTIFRCHKERAHGTVDLKQALALCCNVYFYNVGIRLEIERLSRYAQAARARRGPPASTSRTRRPASSRTRSGRCARRRCAGSRRRRSRCPSARPWR